MNYNNTASAVRRAAVALLGALVLLAATLVSAGPAQAAPALPGGKNNWVVSVGGLDTTEGNVYQNWVRLGYYEFHEDGTVSTNFWFWHQGTLPIRENAMAANCGGDVPACQIRTVEGYHTADGPPLGYRGVYSYLDDGKTLVVTWQTNRDGVDLGDELSEYWNLEAGLASGGVARIVSPTFYKTTSEGKIDPSVTIPADGVFSDYGATFGVGYGSKASLGAESRASMSELLTHDERYRGAFVVANVNGVHREGAGGDWTFSGSSSKGDNPNDPWKHCSDAECIGYLQPGASICGKSTEGYNRVRYIGEIGGGRRNIEEYWCEGLAATEKDDPACYDYNSHPRPMLQVVDDLGRFQGWVGVEAFTHVTPSGGGQSPDQARDQDYWGVFDMVSISELRPGIDASEINPFSKFRVPYGNSSASGSLRWYNGLQRVAFMGVNHVVSGCRYAEFVAFLPDGTKRRGTTSRFCVGMTPEPNPGAPAGMRNFNQYLDYTGAATPTHVQVTYWVADEVSGPYTTKGTVQCTRLGGTCVSAPRDPGPVTGFKVAHGQSVGTGEVNWYNRSASITGNNHIESGCRFVEMVATGADGSVQRATTTRHCSAGDHPFSQIEFDFGDFAPRDVVVTYWVSEDGGLTYATKETQKCTRGGCVTDSGARDEITEFRLTHGASIATGELHWLERSVTFVGNNHVASGCRYVLLTGTGADGSVKTASTTKFCSAGDHPFGPQTLNFSLVDNGAQRVVVDYYADDGSGYQLKDSTTCTRDGGCV